MNAIILARVSIKEQKDGYSIDAQIAREKVAIVADAVDRIQRGFSESVLLDKLIHEGKIELHFNRKSMVLNKYSR